MRRACTLIVIALLAAAGVSGGRLWADAPAEPSAAAGARIERVVDGDTVVIAGLGKSRLIGIDTPEVFGREECFGREASANAKRLLPRGTAVRYRLGVESRDRYGRALVYLFFKDGRHVNELMVQAGYAVPLTVPPNVEYAERFVRLARGARRASRGLWAACR